MVRSVLPIPADLSDRLDEEGEVGVRDGEGRGGAEEEEDGSSASDPGPLYRLRGECVCRSLERHQPCRWTQPRSPGRGVGRLVIMGGQCPERLKPRQSTPLFVWAEGQEMHPLHGDIGRLAAIDICSGCLES